MFAMQDCNGLGGRVLHPEMRRDNGVKDVEALRMFYG
jgi:hypothetical protein